MRHDVINWRGRTFGIPNPLFYALCLLLSAVLLALAVMADGGSGKRAQSTLLPAARHMAFERRDGGLGCITLDMEMTKIVMQDQHGHRAWHLEANGDAKCNTTPEFRPRTFSAQICIQKYKNIEVPPGHGFVDIGCGPYRHRLPNPQHHYWLNMPCQKGTFRAALELFGDNYKGRNADTRGFSKPYRNRSCRLPRAAVTVSAHLRQHRDSIFGCNVSVKTRRLMLEAHSVTQAYAKLGCHRKPQSFHSRTSLQKSEGGTWATVARGKLSRKNPYPFGYYWTNKACGPGRFRTKFTAGGSNADGMPLAGTSFYSKPVTIRECVSGGAFPSRQRAAASAVLVAAHPVSLLARPDIVADCKAPKLSFYKHWNHINGQWQKIASMLLECGTGDHSPRLLNWQLDTQQWHKGKNGGPGHWAYYKFNRQHHLARPHTGGDHGDGQETKCSPGTFRTAVQIWGTSSTGLVDPGEMFCTEPGFKIRSCAPKGPGRAKPRPHRGHVHINPHVPGQKTVRCDPLPAPV